MIQHECSNTLPRFDILLIGTTIIGLSGCEVTESRVSKASALLDEIGLLDSTPSIDMPTSGSATYTGYATGEIDVSSTITDTVIADANFTATFSGAGGTLSGSMSNFSASTGGFGSTQSTDMAGSLLTLSGGTISGNSFTGAIDGTLIYNSNTITVDAAASGGFLGPAADTLLGEFIGSSSVSSGYSGNVDMVVFGKQAP